jgi:hypothetical protein
VCVCVSGVQMLTDTVVRGDIPASISGSMRGRLERLNDGLAEAIRTFYGRKRPKTSGPVRRSGRHINRALQMPRDFWARVRRH